VPNHHTVQYLGHRLEFPICFLVNAVVCLSTSTKIGVAVSFFASFHGAGGVLVSVANRCKGSPSAALQVVAQRRRFQLGSSRVTLGIVAPTAASHFSCGLHRSTIACVLALEKPLLWLNGEIKFNAPAIDDRTFFLVAAMWSSTGEGIAERFPDART
jgi:hypothetical protein